MVVVVCVRACVCVCVCVLCVDERGVLLWCCVCVCAEGGWSSPPYLSRGVLTK